MPHDHTPADDGMFTQEFWDTRYSSRDHLWSGRPNVQLVEQVSDLAPGAALDAGCGEGADAIWLASRGWTVTAVDLSQVALERAARQAAADSDQIAERISWEHADLLEWEPGERQFDLVSVQFLHLPAAPLEALHTRLAATVRVGGSLLVVNHHPDDLHANVGRPGADRVFQTADQIAAELEPGAWEIVVAEAVERSETDLDGKPTTVKDTVLRAVRR